MLLGGPSFLVNPSTVQLEFIRIYYDLLGFTNI